MDKRKTMKNIALSLLIGSLSLTVFPKNEVRAEGIDEEKSQNNDLDQINERRNET